MPSQDTRLSGEPTLTANPHYPGFSYEPETTVKSDPNPNEIRQKAGINPYRPASRQRRPSKDPSRSKERKPHFADESVSPVSHPLRNKSPDRDQARDNSGMRDENPHVDREKLQEAYN